MAYTKPYTDKEKKEMIIVEKGVKAKKTIKRISEENPGLYTQKIDKIVKALIRDGRISKELIQANAKAQFLRTKNKGRAFTIEEQYEIVANMLEKGFLFSEIIEKYEEAGFTIHRLDKIKDRLIKEGRIDKDKVEAKRQERLKQINEEEKNSTIKIIKKYIKKGYTKVEIADIIGYERHAITRLINEYSSKNPWFSEEELNSFKEKRKKSVDDEIEIIKKHMQNGLSYDEIAETMKSNKTHISKVVKKYKENNPWFSKEDFKLFKMARIEREESEKRQKEEQEEKEKEKTESLLKRYDIYRKRIIRVYNEYISGKKNKVSMFEDYINTLLEMEEKKLEVDINDIKMASILIADCTELVNKKYLKYIILQYYKFLGEESTIVYINRVIRENEDDVKKQDIVKKLLEYKKVIHELNTKNEVIKLVQKGEKINDIAKYLGITYQDVIELYKKEINVDFDQR